MQPSRFFYFLIICCLSTWGFGLLSCRYSPPEFLEEPSGSLMQPIRIIPAGAPKITEVNPDSLTVIYAEGSALAVNPPEITAANTNIIPAGLPAEIPVPESLPVVIPGENGVPLPKSVKVQGEIVPARNPVPTTALPPVFRDNATIDVRYLDQDQGMSASTVLAILEDRRGHLWFSTVGGGLSRYDGSRFFHFTVKEGLKSHLIFDIYEDRHGYLWLGYSDNGGITRYDGVNFIHFSEEQGLSTSVVYDITEDSLGQLWMGTEDVGVVKYDGHSFTFFTEKEGLADNTVFKILYDSRGHQWYSTEDGGLCRFDGTGFTHFSALSDLGNTVVTSMLEDRNGRIWFSTAGKGLFIYDGHQFIQYSENEGLSGSLTNALLEDEQGDIWFATKGEGVSRFDGSCFINYSDKQGLNHNTILSMIQDSRGTIWLGTEGGGVNKLMPGSFQHYNLHAGLGGHPVRTILEDSKGNLWMGNRIGEVIKYDGHQFSKFPVVAGRDRILVSALEDRHGIIWFGSFGEGLVRFDPGTNTRAPSLARFSRMQGLPNHDLELIREDSKGNLWLGTFGGGVMKFDGKRFTHYTEKDGLGSQSVLSILEDSRGNMWLGTYQGGVVRFDGQRFAVFTTAEGLSHDIVRCIYEDSNGHLWLGTEGGGITKYDGQNFIHYQLDESEGAANIRSIQEDPNGNFWFGTMNGLYYAREMESDSVREAEAYRVFRLDRGDGLKGVDFLRNSICLDHRNQLWWGTEKGLTTIDVDQWRMPTTPPKVLLTGILLDQSFVDFQHLEDFGLDQIKMDNIVPFYNFPKTLELPPKANSPSFQYGAIDESAPNGILYQSMLVGFEDSWSPPNPNNQVDYRNLPHGSYTFQVRALGKAGVWSEPATFSFLIYPPWWQTRWAYGAYFLLFFGLLFALRRYELQRRRIKHLQEIERARIEEKARQAEKIEAQALELQKSNRELQEKNVEILAAREQLIVQEKLASLGHLTAGLAHEIKNPLNYINNFAEGSVELAEELLALVEDKKESLDPELLQEISALANYLKQNTGEIKISGGQIDRIVRSMMDHARDADVSWQMVDLNKLLDENVHLAYHSYRMIDASFTVEIQKEYDPALPLVNVLPQHLGRVFLNILSNGCYAVNQKRKEAGNGYQPAIRISTQQTEESVDIIIRDNGPGIAPEIQKEIFTPFFTTKPTGQGNTGLGLSISYDIIVKDHKGRLEMESDAENFTSFIITLPKNYTPGS